MGAPVVSLLSSEAAAATAAAAVPELPRSAAISSSSSRADAVSASDPAPALDAEKLHVYAVALELQALCATLVPLNHRVLQDQLERASLSVVCCVAEGAGRRSKKDKRRLYTMARGSAMETAAIIDVLRVRKLAPEGACASARSLALRVTQMLTKLDRALA